MLTITQTAQTTLSELLQNSPDQAARIRLVDGSCGIRFFAIAPDKLKATDHSVFTSSGHHCIIDRNLLEEFAPIIVDSDRFSFRISGGGIEPPTACGTCPFSCGSRGKSTCTGQCETCTDRCRVGKRKLARKQFDKNCIQ